MKEDSDPVSDHARPALVFNRPGLTLLTIQLLTFCVGTVAVASWVYFRTHHRFLLIYNLYQWWTIWFPLVSLGIAVAGFALAARSPFRKPLVRAGALVLTFGLLCFLSRVYATHIEPKMLWVREETLVTSKVSQPLRILHISDIQSGGVGEYEARAIAMMQELQPDLIIHTGDLLHPLEPNTYNSELPKIDSLLQELDPPLGFFNLVGDTDWPIERELAAGVGGMETLFNEARTITIGDDSIELFGLVQRDSHNEAQAEELFTPWLNNTSSSDLRILLGHGPDFVLRAQNHDIDLCLAGHTHGGQIRIPFFGPIMTLSDVPRDLALGWHKVGKTTLNVTAGIGAEHAAQLPSIRVNCPPEMTLITILPEE